MKRKITFSVFFLIVTFIQAQVKKEILGIWIKTKIENVGKELTPDVQQRNKKFFRYTFERNNQLFISLSPNEKGNLIKYRIERDIINLGFNKFKIEKLNNEQLVLIEFENNKITPNSVRISFLKEQSYLNQLALKEEDILIRGGDELFFETDKVYPKFNNVKYANVNEFIQPFVENLSDNENAFAYATFLVDTKGKVSDVQIHHHINETYDKGLRKAIMKTSGMWTPPFLNGKKVSVVKEITFNYIEFPNFERNGDNLTIKPYNAFKESYKNQFKNATQLYLRGNYDEALKLLLDIEFSDSFNVDNLKRKIYERLEDTTNYRLTTQKLKKSRLSYLIGQKQ